MVADFFNLADSAFVNNFAVYNSGISFSDYLQNNHLCNYYLFACYKYYYTLFQHICHQKINIDGKCAEFISRLSIALAECRDYTDSSRKSCGNYRSQYLLCHMNLPFVICHVCCQSSLPSAVITPIAPVRAAAITEVNT